MTAEVMATPPIATVATAVATTLPVVIVAAVASPVIHDTARCNTDAVTVQARSTSCPNSNAETLGPLRGQAEALAPR
jgi:hypothetical protein